MSKVVRSDFEKNGGRHPDLAKSRLIVSRSHAGEVHNVTERVFGSGATVTPAGGAGYKAWEVVKGEQGRWRKKRRHFIWTNCSSHFVFEWSVSNPRLDRDHCDLRYASRNMCRVSHLLVHLQVGLTKIFYISPCCLAAQLLLPKFPMGRQWNNCFSNLPDET